MVRKPPKPRKLTREEQALWAYITRHDQTLPGRQAALPEQADASFESVIADTKPITRNPSKHLPPLPASLSSEADGKQVDKRTAQRFRRGKRGIEATLDLHGMGREAAYMRLIDFIETAYHAQKRTLLIITGKGQRTGGPGILKEALPGWLSQPPISPHVLIFDQAQPRDGGAGATYVLLRRKRTS